MLTDPALRSQVDALWDKLWAGGLSNPLDAQVLPGDRVLITESGMHRVTERNFKGEILWEKALTENPVAAQRLPNGNTFIVTHDRLFEVDRAGKEVLISFMVGAPTITTARRLRDGRIACILAGGKCQLLDAAGKRSKNFPVSPAVQTTSGLDALPGGGVLVVEYGNNKVVEHNAEGKLVWSATVQRPISAVRLPSGNTLVSSQDNFLVELNRSGKVVWEHKISGHPTRVRRR
jgi:hypothetical protein